MTNKVRTFTDTEIAKDGIKVVVDYAVVLTDSLLRVTAVPSGKQTVETLGNYENLSEEELGGDQRTLIHMVRRKIESISAEDFGKLAEERRGKIGIQHEVIAIHKKIRKEAL